MNGEGISLVGPQFNIPFGNISGLTPTSILFADGAGKIGQDPVFVYWGNRLYVDHLQVTNIVTLNNVTATYLELLGRLKKKQVNSAVTPYAFTGNDNVLFVTTGAGAFIVNILTAVGSPGLEIIIKKVDAGIGVCTITPNGAETIDGAPNYALAVQNKYVVLVSDGANWGIVGNN